MNDVSEKLREIAGRVRHVTDRASIRALAAELESLASAPSPAVTGIPVAQVEVLVQELLETFCRSTSMDTRADLRISIDKLRALIAAQPAPPAAPAVGEVPEFESLGELVTWTAKNGSVSIDGKQAARLLAGATKNRVESVSNMEPAHCLASPTVGQDVGERAGFEAWREAGVRAGRQRPNADHWEGWEARAQRQQPPAAPAVDGRKWSRLPVSDRTKKIEELSRNDAIINRITDCYFHGGLPWVDALEEGIIALSEALSETQKAFTQALAERPASPTVGQADSQREAFEAWYSTHDAETTKDLCWLLWQRQQPSAAPADQPKEK